MQAPRLAPCSSKIPTALKDIPAQCIYEHADERVLPYEFVGDMRMLLIGASMGTGKTHQVRQYLTKHPDLVRVLIITADEQHATATHSALADLQWDDGSRGFTCSVGFVDEPREHLSLRLGRFDKLIVNYTSLCQMVVGVGISVYDLVIVDDIRNVLSAAEACVTFSNELRLDHRILQTMVACRRSICLGANIETDGSVWGWASETVGDLNIQYHRYTYVADHRTVVLVDQVDWIRQVRDSLALGHRVGVICRSERRFHTLMALRDVASRNTLAFTSDCDQEQIRQLQNIDKHLDGVAVLAFGGKTATAIDIQEPFHTIYVHCGAVVGPCPREVLQMVGRFRCVTSGRVVCCLPSFREPAPGLSYAGECGVISRLEDVGVKLQSWLGYGRLVSTANGISSVLVHPLVALTAHGRVERNGCFAKDFYTHVRHRGWWIDFVVD